MVDIETIRDLFNHMQWADTMVWASILKDTRSSEDAKLRDALSHIHNVQYAFLLIWQGRSLDGQFPQFSESSQVKHWAQKNYEEIDSYLKTVKEGALQELITLPWSAMIEQRIGRAPAITTLGETALQVATHSAYHRGQANTRLRDLNVEPPLVDYIAWVWIGRPMANWL